MQHNLHKHFFAFLQLKPSLDLVDKNTDVLFPVMKLIPSAILLCTLTRYSYAALVKFQLRRIMLKKKSRLRKEKAKLS